MRRSSLVLCVLLAFALNATLFAQHQPAPPRQQPATASPQVWMGGNPTPGQNESSVPPSQPVITVKGVCGSTIGNSTPPAGGEACVTTVTREEFEKLVGAVNTNNQPLRPEVRRSLGLGLAELVVWADAATKAGIEKDPSYQETMKLVRVRTLHDMYLQRLQQQAGNASPQELQNYYNQNVAKYQELKLQRIFIPGNSPAGPGDSNFYTKAQQLAATLQERAAKGEDFGALQKEAYGTLGLASPPPSIEMGAIRKGMLRPEEEKEVSGLEVGQVTKVITETSGFLIFKVESKQAQPFDQVKDAVTRDMVRSKVDAKIKEVNAAAHADLDTQYFATAPPAPSAAPTLGPPR